ncbi:hypothetical protein Lyticum_00597 [Lyticum sinuosum]|uniref:Uncharacterized protein n=1 Tax=Lyticum sinuosum TaxID=1332059 RepID=A0AAE4VK44_9RICK|nr:hypothetical protein [Lyticum sinuosum]
MYSTNSINTAEKYNTKNKKYYSQTRMIKFVINVIEINNLYYIKRL